MRCDDSARFLSTRRCGPEPHVELFRFCTVSIKETPCLSNHIPAETSKFKVYTSYLTPCSTPPIVQKRNNSTQLEAGSPNDGFADEVRALMNQRRELRDLQGHRTTSPDHLTPGFAAENQSSLSARKSLPPSVRAPSIILKAVSGIFANHCPPATRKA